MGLRIIKLNKKPKLTEEQNVIREFTRDLSVCTSGEIDERWQGDSRRFIDHHLPTGLDYILKDHDPAYFLAQKVYFNDVLGDKSLLDPAFHREQICRPVTDYLLNETDDSGLILLSPRNSLKSTFFHGVVPLWYALRRYHLDGYLAHIGLYHHKLVMASRNLKRLKAKLVTSRWLREIWTEFTAQEDFDTATSFSWPCVPETGDVAEESVVAAGLGASLVGSRFDLICYDDIVTDDHIDSKLIRDETAVKYDSTGYTLQVGGKRLHSGTLYHVNDQWRKLRKAKIEDPETGEERPLYRQTLIHACVNKEGVPCLPYDKGAQFALPHRLNARWLEKKRKEEIAGPAGNDNLWWLQYQNYPKSAGMIATDPSWLHYCKDDVVPDDAWGCITVDPAWKGTDNAGEGDFASIQVWFFERRGNLVLRYLRDGVHSNELTEADGRHVIFRLMRRYGILDVAPEERGGYAFSTNLVNAAVEEGTPLNIIKLQSQQRNKSARITTFLGQMQQGRVFLCDGCNEELIAAFKDQFMDYPQVEHDDALDCAAYSCDPAINEEYGPAYDTKQGLPSRPWMQKARQQQEELPSTRYGPGGALV
jgi:predicted phage terminase large subunit-like protein